MHDERADTRIPGLLVNSFYLATHHPSNRDALAPTSIGLDDLLRKGRRGQDLCDK